MRCAVRGGGARRVVGRLVRSELERDDGREQLDVEDLIQGHATLAGNVFAGPALRVQTEEAHAIGEDELAAKVVRFAQRARERGELVVEAHRTVA